MTYKKVKKPTWINTETRSAEILMIVASWFLQKKKFVRIEIHKKIVKNYHKCTQKQTLAKLLRCWLSGFFERKNPVRIEIYQKSLTEMLIL